MRKISVLIGVVAVLGLFSMSQSFAQQGMQWRGGGWGAGAQYGRLDDPKTAENISGEVISVNVITPVKEMCYGVHLMVKINGKGNHFCPFRSWLVH